MAAAMGTTVGCRAGWAAAAVGAALLGSSTAWGEVVGRVAGQGDVSPSGSATYTIPIAVAAGMNGLKPDVALVYDSQSGPGLAGVGWTLSGFSKIHRCGHTIALDGRVRGVTYSAADRFCLDGSPLIMVSGSNYATAGAEYRTELHQYQKITAVGSQGSGPASFTVQAPNGQTWYFGDDEDSQIRAPGTTEVRVWALNRIEDKFGNQIKYKYVSPATGEYVPDEITWTATGTGTGPYSLKFTYGDLTTLQSSAVRSGYLFGAQWQATRRLDEIEYKYNGNRVQLYQLTYKTPGTSGRARLESVTQCGSSLSPSASNCLAPTEIGWLDDGAGVSSPIIGSTLDPSQSAFGDYDGDGADDIFFGKSVSGVKRWHVLLAASDGSYSSVPLNLGH